MYLRLSLASGIDVKPSKGQLLISSILASGGSSPSREVQNILAEQEEHGKSGNLLNVKIGQSIGTHRSCCDLQLVTSVVDIPFLYSFLQAVC